MCVSVWRNSSPTGLGGTSPSGHAAQHVNGRRVQRSEVITEEDPQTNKEVYQTLDMFYNHPVSLLLL